ncbi:uncharacterized protein, YigZ family [Acetitomaculum ruminis DSM 5522]|uniref:Uncharacterized protein, YigZ family n=1 Tax=Acetitomaculum ruminis DSM 5522 TaxID=1120918 RepID=A0A1I0XB08_9FIRM|nr:YigZ family protein [Acetitomaculum ruminis]SFA98205.1 uncharacterized protein, YigZ family [Acetitomaculum ruminis DSM 5522]
MNKQKSMRQGGVGEIVEKKSRFIASTCPVYTEEEAISFINKIKKQYYDAKHNCYAYVIGDDDNIQKSSDDGEPSRTAGMPILDIIKNEGLHNVVIVVTRYFGGILLGTGGLVRAYSQAAKEGIANSLVISREKGMAFDVNCPYDRMGKLEYLLRSLDANIINTDYGEYIVYKAVISIENYKELTDKLLELFNGENHILNINEVFFGFSGDEIIIE